MNQKLIFTLLVFSLVLPNIVLFFTEFTSLLTRVINIVLPLSLFWLAMTFAKKPGKAYWSLFLFVFFNAFQIVLLYLFGNSVIAVDMFLNLVTTNSGEAMELLGNLIPAVLFVILFYGGCLTVSVFSILNNDIIPTSYIKRQRILSISLFVVSLILLGVEYYKNSDFKFQDDIFPFNVCYNIGLAVEREVKSNNYAETSKDFRFNATSSHDKDQKEIYVLVIGETARADNFGIYGYERETTPKLDSLKDELVIFRDALSQSNTTHKSVPMLLSAVSAKNYDDIYHQRGIMEAFKEAGFFTAFISNQRRNHSFIDYFGEEADNCIFVKDNMPDNQNVSDDILLASLKDELEKNNKNKIFIVLHTYGSHFNYKERYPNDLAKFLPDSVTTVGYKNKEFLLNAYDNSILYTDRFLAQVIDILKTKDAVTGMLYTSDHGEDLYDDDRKLFLHASPIPSYYQLRIPFLFWISEEYKSNYKESYDILKSHTELPISNHVVSFPSILSMAGVSGNQINKSESVFNKEFKVTKRYYLNDHNKPEELDKIGLQEEDEVVFKRNKILYP